jgi:hypothetical protein
MIRSVLRSVATGTSIVALLLTGPGVARQNAALAAPLTIAPLHGETTVEAYGDVAVWSDYDATTRSWHVFVRSGGHISSPSIPSAPRAIEVDVGPNSSGVPTLAYVNCTGGCHVVISKLDGGNPQIVPGSQRASHPTIWGNRVAWVSAKRKVIISRWDGSGRRRLGGAPRRKCYESIYSIRPHLVCEATLDTSVDALALYHRQLALIDAFWLKGGMGVGIGGSGLPTEVRLEPVGRGPQKLVAVLTPGEGHEGWVGPSWWGGRLYFYKNGEGPYPFVYRFDPRHNRYAGVRPYGPAYADLTGFSMLDGQRAFEVTAPDDLLGEYMRGCAEERVVACVVRLSEPFVFKPSRTPVHVLP